MCVATTVRTAQAALSTEYGDVAAVTKNTTWLAEIQRYVAMHGDAVPCRYVVLDDPLHPNVSVQHRTHTLRLH